MTPGMSIHRGRQKKKMDGIRKWRKKKRRSKRAIKTLRTRR